MFTEHEHVRQVSGETRRRWFTSESLDLIVWQGQGELFFGFQLTYNDSGEDHVLTWTRDKGYSHERLDSGEGNPMQYKMTPVLLPDGEFIKQPVLDAFKRETSEGEEELFKSIARIIDAYV